MIEQVEQAIVARLKARTDFRGWAVEPYPDLPERVATASPRTLFVSYEGSSDTEFTGTSTRREVMWGVTVVTKGLRGKEGAGTALDNVRRALMGWTPSAGGEPFAVVKDGPISESEGKWTFVVTFRTALPCVANPETGNDPLYNPSGRREDGSFDLDTFLNEDVVSDPSPVDPTLLNNR